MALEIFTDGKNERKQRRRTENETLVLFHFFHDYVIKADIDLEFYYLSSEDRKKKKT